MSHPITTSKLEGGDVSTEHESGQSVREWVQKHVDELKGKKPAGDALVTTWTSADGPQTIETPREPGESDQDFLDRHTAEFTAAMATETPIP